MDSDQRMREGTVTERAFLHAIEFDDIPGPQLGGCLRKMQRLGFASTVLHDKRCPVGICRTSHNDKACVRASFKDEAGSVGRALFLPVEHGN